MLILAVNLKMTPGHDNEVTDMFLKLQAATRQEPGCIAYVVQRSRENPHHYLVYEQYKNEAALEEHRNSPHFKKFAICGTCCSEVAPCSGARAPTKYVPVPIISSNAPRNISPAGSTCLVVTGTISYPARSAYSGT